MPSVREVLLGPSYFFHRRLIERSKGWSADEVREYQERRLRRLTARYGDGVTTKDDYRRSPQRYCRWKMPLLTHTVRTGGTIGQPLRFEQDTLARRQKERAYLFDIWSQVGFQPGDLRVVFRGAFHDRLVRLNRLENAWIISPDAATEERLGELRQWVQTLPPFFLHVYPSSLFTFIDLIGEDLFRRLPVRGVLAGSEVFPTSEQTRFEDEFGIRIAHWYGHSEYAALAYCCRTCHGFHFYPTYGAVELLDADLDTDLDGLHHIIASSYNRIGTQFVRYDTGDLARPAHGTCHHDHFLRIAAVVGRSQETFTDRTGRKRALLGYVWGTHESFWDHIHDWQFVQEQPGRLRVRIVTHHPADRTRIQHTLQQRLPMVDLEFDYVPNIPRTQNGKRRYFLDLTPK